MLPKDGARGRRSGRASRAGSALVILSVLAACSSAGSGSGRPSDPTTPAARTSTAPAPPPSAAPSAPSASSSATTPASSSAAGSPAPTSATPTTSSGAAAPTRTPAGSRPVIVLDPGHSPTIHAIDPATGLDVSDYENEPEMHDVFAVAELVRARLRADGYRVVMTKKTVDQRVSLGARAAIANRVHATLALSIHDQAGSNGGIGFSAGNNTVYYQSVGTYRATPAGRKVYFTDRKLARISRRDGQIFRAQRARAQGVPINLQGDVGYDLGSRGLAPGDIWIVQLLSRVPWIYNEAGGNSAGQVGLDPADKHTYADGLVAAVEECVAPPARVNSRR